MGTVKRIRRRLLKRIIGYFFQGFVILAPIAITVYALYWLFERVDNILRPYVDIPGLGFFLIIAGVIVVGWISSSFLMGGLLNLFDQWLERMPGIKLVYTSTRDFFEAFAGNKKKFNKAVLANMLGPDVWMIGFVTDEELEKFELGAGFVSVYVPQGYNFAGQLYLLPREKVRKIKQFSSGDAMKYAVTGGIVDPDGD